MKSVKTLEEVVSGILEDSKAKRDYVATTSALTMTPEAELAFKANGEERVYKPTGTCLGQIGDRVGIPRKYAERMAKEAPQLLATNVNHWFHAKPETRMLRTYDNGDRVARAFLSDRYRPLDNVDLAHVILPKLLKAGCEVRSIQCTEHRLYIQASTPRINSLIRQAKATGRLPDRPVEAGVTIGNSEVGFGSIFVDPTVYDLSCLNGMVTGRSLKRHHVGRKNSSDEFEQAFEVFTDKTKELDDKAFWAKACDVVDAALSEIEFHKNVDRINATATEELPTKKVSEIVEVTSKRFNLSDDEGESMLQHLAAGGDFTKFGVIAAVTRTAQDVENYDRSMELERMTADIIELPAKNWAL